MTDVQDEQRPWDEPAWLAVLLGTVVAAYAANVAVYVAFGATKTYTAPELGVMLAVRETVALGVVGLLARRYLHASWSALGLRRFRWWHVVVGILLGLVTAEAAAWVAHILDGGHQEPWLSALTGAATPSRLVVVAVVAVYSPFVQEVVFRGLLLQGLLQRTNVPVAVVLSSAIFAAVHAASGIGSVASAFMLGILQALLFVRFRSLTAPIASHVAVNAWAMERFLHAVH